MQTRGLIVEIEPFRAVDWGVWPRTGAHGRGLATFRGRRGDGESGELRVRVTWNIMDEGRQNTDLLELVEPGEMFLCYFTSSYLGRRVPPLEVLETPTLL